MGSFTPEQRAKAIETRRRNQEAAKAAASTTAVAERPVVDEGMADILKLLGASVADAQKAANVEDQLITLLSGLDPEKHKDLFKNPKVQAFFEAASEKRVNAADVPPGTILNPGSPVENAKPWTMDDIMRTYPLVEFTPHESKQVFFDGVMWQFIRRKKVTVPKIFVDLYEEAEENIMYAENHAAFLFGNAQPASPDMMTPEAARVRGMGRGTHYPGGGYDAAPAAPAPAAA